MCGEFEAFPSNETATSVGEAKLPSSTNHMLSACKNSKVAWEVGSAGVFVSEHYPS